ncbi:MAG: protein kinase [Myxococcota bacterium]
MDLSPGMHLTPNVRLVRPLARGGMGEVWVADHLTLKIEVAVKLLPDRLGADDALGATRFAEEAATVARIKSPYVVQTHDSGVAPDGTCFIVMELLEGETLAQQLTRRTTLSLAETANLVGQVGRALTAAHRLGIVHRDVKPENIFITATEDGPLCKVLDFGIAAGPDLPGDWQESDTIDGTPEYLAPEAFRGASAGARTEPATLDAWALAVVAYRCLVGRLPFAGDTLGLLGLNVLGSSYLPPSKVRAELPPAVDGWFATAFHPDPAARFQDVRALTDALAAAMPGAGIPWPLDVSASAAGFSVDTLDGAARPAEARLPPAAVRGLLVLALVTGGAAAAAVAMSFGVGAASEADPRAARSAPAPPSSLPTVAAEASAVAPVAPRAPATAMASSPSSSSSLSEGSAPRAAPGPTTVLLPGARPASPRASTWPREKEGSAPRAGAPPPATKGAVDYGF